jgi:hypothetical protein
VHFKQLLVKAFGTTLSTLPEWRGYVLMNDHPLPTLLSQAACRPSRVARAQSSMTLRIAISSDFMCQLFHFVNDA